jgi:perosamine synthetase
MIPIAKPLIGEEEIEAVTQVLRSGQLAGGETVKIFESNFAEYLHIPHGIAASSGTTALHAALWSLKLPPGSVVVTTPFTFVASSNAILYCGHIPLFCDIDEKTYNISPQKLAVLLMEHKSKVKALVIVHLYGQPCEMDSIMSLAEEYGLKVIEDCAQSHGASWRGRMTGTFGDLGIFSFYPTKNMTTGEGGMVITKDAGLAERVQMFINHGSKEKYRHEMLGYNFRMTNLAAALGIVQLKHLDEWNAARRRNAGILTGLLKNTDGIQTPYVLPEAEHVFHQYTLRCQRREELADFLNKNGIGTGIHYPVPVHQQHLYQELGFGEISLPGAEKASREVISLPVHPLLTERELEYIGHKVGEYLV